MVKISEEKVIALWLAGEFQSARFSSRLRELICEQAESEAILLKPDLTSEKENSARKNLLFAYRLYLKDDALFDKTEWFEEEWSVSEALSQLEYMDYSYWNEISQQTRKPREAAKTINNNIEVYDVSNEAFREAARVYLAGTNFPPVIAFQDNKNKRTLLEGHLRLTALALAESINKDIQARKVSVILGREINF